MSPILRNRPQLARRFLQTAQMPVSSSYSMPVMPGSSLAGSTASSPWISHTLPLLSRAKPFAARLDNKKNRSQTSSAASHADFQRLISLNTSTTADSSSANNIASQNISNDSRRARSSANAFSRILNEQKPSSASHTETQNSHVMSDSNKRPDWARAPAAPGTSSTPASVNTASSTSRPVRKFRPRKAAITFTANAVKHVKQLLNGPNPKLLKIGVRNRGCSGLTYNLEYVEKPGPFDEEVVQDGVKVLIDSKALFSIIGSEMDYQDNKLSSKFVFNNPNSKGQCGCGESFMV